eukprot:CAMPEP_0177766270 /NCGR_PEP_ID=MMETSP0491_2-20121128/8439_1 /TAXON_ID=63592 /ORGANISM="Tetraselmis chuii, Strain PLY429" /LENGTH=590 /DNA_ID=CAMNT_0019282681 /DNA_START=386 /DNA_END=2155 /DNA_ORIENTATION=-
MLRAASLTVATRTRAREALGWWRRLTGTYGSHFVVYLMFGQHFLKGVLAGGGTGGLLVIRGRAFMAMGVDASTKAAYQAASSVPWALKPGLGMVNDLLPIGGYHKSVYIILCAALSAASLVMLGTLGIHTPPPLACILFMLVVLQVAWTDLMCEGMYTVKMAEQPQMSADLLSWVWSGIAAWGVLGVVFAGPGIDAFGPFVTAWLGVPFAVAVTFPTLAGWHGEIKVRQRSCGVIKSITAKERPYFVAAAVLFVMVAVNSGMAIAGTSSKLQFYLTLTVAAVLSAVALWLLPRQVALVMVYMVVSASLALDLTGATDYWYLDDPHTCQLYNGYKCPGFSNSFFYSIVGAVDCVCMLLGSMAFSTLMRHWTYVDALNVSQGLLVLVNALDVVMFERWNRQMGVPDWIFMLGKSAVQNTVAQMNFLPTTLLISKLCPPGIETTVFAMLAAYHNFGMAVAGYFSSFFFTLVPGLSEVNGSCGTSTVGDGTVTCCTGPTCSCSDGCDDFSQLWKMSLLAAILPGFTIVFNYLFIPKLPMSAHTEWDEAAGVLRLRDIKAEMQMSEMGTDTCDFGTDTFDLGSDEVRLADEDEKA